MRTTRPLRSRESRRTKEREPRLERMREATTVRSGNQCEWPGCTRRRPLDPCHGFGRGNQISAALADQPCMAWRGCRHHHNVMDGHERPADELEAAQAEQMKWWLIGMAVEVFGDVPREPGDHPVDVARRLERQLVADGRMRLLREGGS